jgi:hypothetical protein
MDCGASVVATGNGSGGSGNVASSQPWNKLLQYVNACSRGADPAQAFAALTKGHEHDPRIQALGALLPHATNFMAARSGDASKQSEERHEREAPSGVGITGRLRQRRTVRKLLAEVETSRELLARLAIALGACTCFGNPVCNVCLGEGRPGRYAPDGELFERFIAPAVSRLAGRTHAPDCETTQAGEDDIPTSRKEG